MPLITVCPFHNETVVTVISPPERFELAPTPTYLKLLEAARPFLLPCLDVGVCSCADRFMSDGKARAYISMSDCHEVRRLAEYCQKYEAGLERSLLRQKRLREASGSHTESDLILIARWQRFSCYFCSCLLTLDEQQDLEGLVKEAHWDHLTPISRGGSNFPSNMALTCSACNLIKSKKNEREFWKIIIARFGSEYAERIQQQHASYAKLKRNLNRLRV